jgi:hypothetical protein
MHSQTHKCSFLVFLSVGIMQMVRSDLGAAGVIFSKLNCLQPSTSFIPTNSRLFLALDTESGHPDVVFITGAYGLGENVVQGSVDPDDFYVHKPTYAQGFRAVLNRRMGKKQQTMIYDDGEGGTVKNTETSEEKRGRYCLTDGQVLELAGFALAIEKHYSELKGGWQRGFGRGVDLGRSARVTDRSETLSNGHRMGPRRPHPRALHRPSPPRNRTFFETLPSRSKDIQARGEGEEAGEGTGSRDEYCAGICEGCEGFGGVGDV